MLKVVHGDLLNAKEAYIAHQVNCYGVMGRGVSLQIKNKYPDVFRRYAAYCSEHRVKNLIGRVLLIPTDDGKIICNLFGQQEFEFSNRKYTDYAALSKAMKSLEKIVPVGDKIAMPYMLGCGNSGGSWDIISKLIEDIFKKHNVVIYKQ